MNSFISFVWFGFYVFMFNKYDFILFLLISFPCMCIHVDVYIFMYDSFIYVCVSVFIYF